MCYRCPDYEYEPCPDNYPNCEGECYGFDCSHCGQNTLHIREYYMVTDEVWSKAWPDERGMLCIGCLEVLLGRMLNALDFTDAPVNTAYQERSARLIDRLTSDV